MTTYIIDRIEDGIAVLECLDTDLGNRDEMLELPRAALPKGVREGQVLRKDGDGFTIDYEATQKRRDNMRSRLDKLLKKDKNHTNSS